MLLYTYPKSNCFCQNKKCVLLEQPQNSYPDQGIGSLFNMWQPPPKKSAGYNSAQHAYAEKLIEATTDWCSDIYAPPNNFL